MKYIITESQYRFIVEQKKEFNPVNGQGTFYGTYGYDKKGETPWTNLDSHTKLVVGQIVTAVIPVVGPFISAGLGLVDSALYYKEGDKGTAGITALFSLLPFVGKIPGVKEFGSKVWSTLASKISSGIKLSQSEIGLVNEVVSNSDAVKTALNNASSKLSPFAKQIQQLKPGYVQRYGQEAYEKLMKDFISGTSDQKTFLNFLKSGQNASPKSANFVSKFGIKLTKNEIDKIHEITGIIKKLPRVLTKAVFDGIITNNSIRVMTKEGLKKIDINFITSKQAVKLWGENSATSYGAAWGDELYFIVDNIKKMNPSDLDQLFYHEVTHIKDPGIVSSKLEKLYNSNVARYSPEYFSKGYYFHPKELIANTSKILVGISTNVKRSMKQLGKEKTLKALNDLISWSKGQKKDFTEEMIKVLGYDQPFVKQHLEFLTKNPKEYRNLVAKIAQQSNYLKSQVNLAL